jgi:hypothetical protein
LDNAVGEFGRSLEAAINDVEGKNKKEVEMKVDRVVRRWLDMPLKFRDPANG